MKIRAPIQLKQTAEGLWHHQTSRIGFKFCRGVLEVKRKLFSPALLGSTISNIFLTIRGRVNDYTNYYYRFNLREQCFSVIKLSDLLTNTMLVAQINFFIGFLEYFCIRRFNQVFYLICSDYSFQIKFISI